MLDNQTLAILKSTHSEKYCLKIAKEFNPYKSIKYPLTLNRLGLWGHQNPHLKRVDSFFMGVLANRVAREWFSIEIGVCLKLNEVRNLNIKSKQKKATSSLSLLNNLKL